MEISLPPRVTQRAFDRLTEINAKLENPKALRVAVDGGGCSGFQYLIELGLPKDDDLVLEKAGIDYSDEIIGARFVINNPNATSSCGCGTSFSL
jgi:iron-sulfur cluster insertion protein